MEHIKHDVEASRYIAYAGMAARAARYLAFTSDVGEAFRPVVNPFIVRFSYGISWAYCIGDVAVEAHRAQQRGVAGTGP